MSRPARFLYPETWRLIEDCIACAKPSGDVFNPRTLTREQAIRLATLDGDEVFEVVFALAQLQEEQVLGCLEALGMVKCRHDDPTPTPAVLEMQSIYCLGFGHGDLLKDLRADGAVKVAKVLGVHVATLRVWGAQLARHAPVDVAAELNRLLWAGVQRYQPKGARCAACSTGTQDKLCQCTQAGQAILNS